MPAAARAPRADWAAEAGGGTWAGEEPAPTAPPEPGQDRPPLEIDPNFLSPSWMRAFYMVEALMLCDRLPGEDGPWHAKFASCVLDAMDMDVEIISCFAGPALRSMPRGDPAVAEALARLPPCSSSPPCAACSVGSESALVFPADRWGVDGVPEAEATVLVPDDSAGAAMRTIHRVFTRPNAKGMRGEVARAFATRPPEDDFPEEQEVTVLRGARREVLRGILCGPGEARNSWLKKALAVLDPHNRHHAPLIGLVGRHLGLPGLLDPQVRGALQVVCARYGERLSEQASSRIRTGLLQTIPIVRQSGPLRIALVDGRATLELVRRELRWAALRRGCPVEQLPPPPSPSTEAEAWWSYSTAMSHDGTAIDWDDSAKVVVPTHEFLGCWPWSWGAPVGGPRRRRRRKRRRGATAPP